VDRVETITLPGLVDIHVHLRDPGQTQKEDFLSGTSAALAGGFTTIIDMPNNAEPIFTVRRLQEKIALARQKAVCDIGFYFGSQGDNLNQFLEASELALGLKLYLNRTTGNFLLDPAHLQKIYKAWPESSPVLLHAEEDVIDVVISSLKGLERPIHVCHMPSRLILEKIIKAKNAGLPVTCGVTPHHLFLNDTDTEQLGVFGQMKPTLKSQADVNFLWEHLDDIDLFESDHAPHTREEKEEGAFCVPGLETTLPLLLRAEHDGRITREQIIDKCFTKPNKLLGLISDETTSVEVLMEEYEIQNESLQTKCSWSPFAGQKVVGKISKVILHNEIVYENGKVMAIPGSGRVVSRGRPSF
jgi:dihydroorotase-like cyclic amidohydrolase